MDISMRIGSMWNKSKLIEQIEFSGGFISKIEKKMVSKANDIIFSEVSPKMVIEKE